MDPRRAWNLAAMALIGAALLLGLATVADYGSSWDEHIRADAGERKLAYYQHLFQGEFEEAREISSKRDNYPGFYDLNLALLRRISPLADVTTGHLFSLLLGLATVAGAVRLGGLLAGPRAGFFSGLILLLIPSFYGHMFINPKDIPFACGYVWSVYWIARWLHDWPAPGWKTIGFTGLCIGITMASRIGGLILVCYLGLFLFLAWLAGSLKKEAPGGLSLRPLLKQVLSAGLVILIALIILALYWPSMHANPFARTGDTLEKVTNYGWTMPVFFEGQFIPAPELPWYYILKMFLLKIPVGILALVLAGAAFSIEHLRQRARIIPSPSSLTSLMVWFAMVFPVAYVIVRDSTFYNGLRHLLFVLPLMAVAAGLALERILSLLSGKRGTTRLLAESAMAAYGLWIAVTCLRLHPYQYVYYNELAGGVSGAAERYETDYWGTVYKDLSLGLLEYLEEEAPDLDVITVNMEHVTWLAEPYLPANHVPPIHLVRSKPEEDDFYMASTSWAADQYYFGEPVVTVNRLGVLLGVVKDRRGLTEEERILGYAEQ